jgi:hypothetical protein
MPRGVVRLVDLPAKAIEVLADKTGFVKARGRVPTCRTISGDFVLVLRAGRTIAGRVARRCRRGTDRRRVGLRPDHA